MLIIGHRGACALLPENTMEAFRLAFEHEAPMIEFDVHLSKDGIPVILHDATLERTTDGKGYIYHYTAAELKKFSASYRFDPKKTGDFPFRKNNFRIPTFEEMLVEFKTQGLGVEIKDRSAELTRKVGKLIEKYGAQRRSIVGSRHTVVSKTMQKEFPEIRRFLSRNEFILHYLEFQRGAKKKQDDPTGVASMPLEACGFRLDDPRFIEYLHERKITVFYWTINDPGVMKDLASKGADGIITNDPGLAVRTLNLKD